MFTTAEEVAAFRRVADGARFTRWGGDCYAYCMLAMGLIDIVMESSLQAYDIQALIPIVEAAGGVVTSWTGGPCDEGGAVVACGDRALHAQVLKLLAGALGSNRGREARMATASPGDLWDNPQGTDGFEFIEYAAPDPAALGRLFEQMGFAAIAKHRAKNVLLFRQGEINFIVNAEPGSFAQAFARVHGPSICAIAFRVKDAARAVARCVEQGAWAVEAHPGPMELNIPAIKGIGDSLIYLVDRYPGNGTGVSIYDIDFVPLPGVDQHPSGAGLTYVDHLTHNVHRGRMEEWAGFYERLFNFREIRYFDIEGKLTGLKSKAMT